MGNAVLRDRQKLAADGIMVIVMAIDAEERVVSGPEIITRGFVYVKEADELLEDIRMVVDDSVVDYYERCNENVDHGRLRNNIKDAVTEFIWKKTKRRPMVLPVILEAD